jgi:hypothetical protein
MYGYRPSHFDAEDVGEPKFWHELAPNATVGTLQMDHVAQVHNIFLVFSHTIDQNALVVGGHKGPGQRGSKAVGS